MDKGEVAFWISAVLAAIKLYEFVGERRVSVTVDAALTGSVEIGNTLTILNKSKNPLTISYYELVWVQEKRIADWVIPFTRKEIDSESPEDPSMGCNIHLKPHEPSHLVFSDQYHFDWGGGLKHDIYLKIWFVGRKQPKWFWVTGPRTFKVR